MNTKNEFDINTVPTSLTEDEFRKHMEYLVNIGSGPCASAIGCSRCPLDCVSVTYCSNRNLRVEQAMKWLKAHPLPAPFNSGWYIFNVTTKTLLSVTHETQAIAEKEAERLAILAPGCVFQVLKLVGQVTTEKPSCKWERIS